MQINESSASIGHKITKKTYFVIPDVAVSYVPQPVRRTVYRIDQDSTSGKVVAWIDNGRGCNPNLYVDSMFYQMYRESAEWETIKSDCGVYNTSKIKLFDMEGM